MPIYEYACRSCEHQFESIQKASEQPLQDCPECGEPTLKKLLSAPVFRLKGSGWYETDFKTGDKRNVAGNGDAEGGAERGKPDEKAGDKADAPKANAADGGGGGEKAKAGAENGKAAKADAKPAKDASGGKTPAAGGKPAPSKKT